MTVPDSVREMLALVPLGGGVIDDLLARMGGPDRHYHDVHHLALLWQRHRALGAGTPMHEPTIERCVACAIAFHDAVYDASRRDSEAGSAVLWRGAAEAAALPPELVGWVDVTIRATADHLGYQPAGDDALERARLWMLDLDLTPIGERPAVFADNTALLRAENGHLDDATWDRRRLGFLASLTRHPRLYRSPAIAAAFEAQARENLRRELAGG